MDLKDLDRRALTSTATFVSATKAEQLGDSTPCEGWDVRALLNHVIGGNLMFGAAVAGEGPDWSTRENDRVGNDLHAAFDRSAAQVTERFAALDLVANPSVELPFGTFPVSAAVAVHFVDVLVHGWDLAHATGQDPTLEPELCHAALKIVASYPAESWGELKFFASQVPVEDGAPPHERLVATLGRRPG